MAKANSSVFEKIFRSRILAQRGECVVETRFDCTQWNVRHIGDFLKARSAELEAQRSPYGDGDA